MSPLGPPVVPPPPGPGQEAPCDHLSPTSFWKRLSRLMSKVNPEPNVIHVMGCYILGNPNGEKVRGPEPHPRLGTPDPGRERTEPRFSPDSLPSFNPPRGSPSPCLSLSSWGGCLLPNPCSPRLSLLCPELTATPSLQLFQNLRSLMTPYRVTFESPLELSAQGELAGVVLGRGVGSGPGVGGVA